MVAYGIRCSCLYLIHYVNSTIYVYTSYHEEMVLLWARQGNFEGEVNNVELDKENAQGSNMNTIESSRFMTP